jgi:plasmid maintenance system antidote protein VapI
MSKLTNRGAVNLASAIEARHLSREAAAALLELAEASGTMTRLLSGERKPGRGLAFKIEREFGVPMAHWEMPVRVEREVIDHVVDLPKAGAA